MSPTGDTSPLKPDNVGADSVAYCKCKQMVLPSASSSILYLARLHYRQHILPPILAYYMHAEDYIL